MSIPTCENCQKFQTQLDQLQKLVDAEKAGKDAARDISLGVLKEKPECPYAKLSDEWWMWEHGFTTMTVIQNSLEREAVVRWALEGLEIVQQIADSEAGAKVKTIREKLEEEFGGLS